MLKGFTQVTRSSKAKQGQFYLAYGHEDGPWLFQCIAVGSGSDPEVRALWFTQGDKPTLSIVDMPGYGPLVELPEVHIRIDPKSLSGTCYSSTLQPGLLTVHGNEVALCARTGSPWGWAAVSLTGGHTIEGAPPQDWISFSRWELVTDNGSGDEIVIAKFSDTSSG